MPEAERQCDQSIYEGAVCVHVDPGLLQPMPEDVAHHAAGQGSTLRGDMRETLRTLLPKVAQRVRPRYAYAAHRVAHVADSSLVLANGVEIPFGLSAVDRKPSGLVAAVCSMGPDTDGLQAELGLEGLLDAWLLDATLLAGLDLLETRCLQDIAGRAAPAGLCVGPALVPGVAGVPDAAQATLFECLGAAAAGVSLNETGAMRPLKSFSCWFPLMVGPAAAADGLHLCERCDLDSCAFRRGGAATRS
jgi:hypothetical protein